MVFESKRADYILILQSHMARVGSKAILRCKIWLGKEKMEEVNEFKYLGTILCKHGSMGEEIMERAVKGRQVMGEVESHERKKCKHGRKKGIRNGVILPRLSHASETRTWNTAEQS